jgi:hypothetical protein
MFNKRRYSGLSSLLSSDTIEAYLKLIPATIKTSQPLKNGISMDLITPQLLLIG